MERLLFGLKLEALAFKALGFGISGGAAARTFFCTIATTVTAAALALCYGSVNAASKIIGRCRYAQNHDNQLNIHASPSCSRWSFSAMWGMCGCSLRQLKMNVNFIWCVVLKNVRTKKGCPWAADFWINGYAGASRPAQPWPGILCRCRTGCAHARAV